MQAQGAAGRGREPCVPPLACLIRVWGERQLTSFASGCVEMG